MELDDKICYCYHVSLRKLLNYARRERLQRPSQMSECLNAGTGCGWCIPILKRIYDDSCTLHDAADAGTLDALPESVDDYAEARRKYIQSMDKNTF